MRHVRSQGPRLPAAPAQRRAALLQAIAAGTPAPTEATRRRGSDMAREPPADFGLTWSERRRRKRGIVDEPAVSSVAPEASPPSAPRPLSGAALEAVVAAAAWLLARPHADEFTLIDLAAAMPPDRNARRRAEHVAAAVEALQLQRSGARRGVAWLRAGQASRRAAAGIVRAAGRRRAVAEKARATAARLQLRPPARAPKP